MAAVVYFKFLSAKEFESIPVDSHLVSVADVKERILERKMGPSTSGGKPKPRRYDIIISNAQNNEELDDSTIIPRFTSLLLRLVPLHLQQGLPRRIPILNNNNKREEEEPQQPSAANPSFSSSIGSIVAEYPEQEKEEDFGGDVYAAASVYDSVQDTLHPASSSSNKSDEDSKIQAVINSSALSWQTHHPHDSFGAAARRGFGRGGGTGMGGARTIGGGLGGGGLELTKPPQGYVCHRCKVAGHFIQHCPTNGDPNFDKNRVKKPTGIPMNMLKVSPDGSYALPSGQVAVVKPDEAAFEREIQGLPSTRPVVQNQIPPELHCPLCKQVMKDAALTSKCCFSSFCDTCIRDHLLSKSICVCGATNVLADDLLPNKTVRETIKRILESNTTTSSTSSTGSGRRRDQSKSRSPALSSTSRAERPPLPPEKHTTTSPDLKEEAQHSVGHQTVKKAAELCHKLRVEAMHDEKAPNLPTTTPNTKEEVVVVVVQQSLQTDEAGNMKKKKKTPSQDLPAAAEYNNTLMPSTYESSYWGGGMSSTVGMYDPYCLGAMPPYNMEYAPADPYNNAHFGGQGTHTTRERFKAAEPSLATQSKKRAADHLDRETTSQHKANGSSKKSKSSYFVDMNCSRSSCIV